MKDRIFRDILPQVSKPARYMGNEVNMIKKEWEPCRIKMAFRSQLQPPWIPRDILQQ